MDLGKGVRGAAIGSKYAPGRRIYGSQTVLIAIVMMLLRFADWMVTIS